MVLRYQYNFLGSGVWGRTWSEILRKEAANDEQLRRKREDVRKGGIPIAGDVRRTEDSCGDKYEYRVDIWAE